jgi:hypothetical protein
MHMIRKGQLRATGELRRAQLYSLAGYRNASLSSKDSDTAREGEDIVNRRLKGQPTPLASPVAMMRLLLILSGRQAETSSGFYRKSWLRNEVVPGFNAEALRVKPSIGKGATAFVPLHLRVALLAGLAAAAKDVVGTLRYLRPACRPFYLRRFDELAAAARGESDVSHFRWFFLVSLNCQPARSRRG